MLYTLLRVLLQQLLPSLHLHDWVSLLVTIDRDAGWLSDLDSLAPLVSFYVTNKGGAKRRHTCLHDHNPNLLPSRYFSVIQSLQRIQVLDGD